MFPRLPDSFPPAPSLFLPLDAELQLPALASPLTFWKIASLSKRAGASGFQF